MINNCSLTSDQDKALELFINWLDKKVVEKPFLLSGFAGSGKTFLSRKFLQIVEDKDKFPDEKFSLRNLE